MTFKSRTIFDCLYDYEEKKETRESIEMKFNEKKKELDKQYNDLVNLVLLDISVELIEVAKKEIKKNIENIKQEMKMLVDKM